MRIRACRGSETVEAALALPVLLLVAFCCLQLALAAYQCAAMSSAVSEAAAKADFTSALSPGADMDREVEKALAAASPGLLEDRIDVTGARSGASSVEFSETSSGAGGVSDDKTLARISATVTYRVPTILSAWGLGDLTVSRDISATVVSRERTEVSR